MWNVRQIHKEKVEKGHLGPLYSHYIYIYTMGKGPINWLVLPNVKKLYRGINFKEKEAKSSIYNNQNTSVVIQSQYPRSQFNFRVWGYHDFNRKDLIQYHQKSPIKFSIYKTRVSLIIYNYSHMTCFSLRKSTSDFCANTTYPNHTFIIRIVHSLSY